MTIVVNEIGVPLRHKFGYKCTMGGGGRRDIIETKFLMVVLETKDDGTCADDGRNY